MEGSQTIYPSMDESWRVENRVVGLRVAFLMRGVVVASHLHANATAPLDPTISRSWVGFIAVFKDGRVPEYG